MAKRNYKLKDIYDYLLEAYNIEWSNYLVLQDGTARTIRNYDFYGKDNDCLKVLAIAYCGSRIKLINLYVSNNALKVYEVDPNLHYYAKPEIDWKDFLAQRYNQEQSLTK